MVRPALFAAAFFGLVAASPSADAAPAKKKRVKPASEAVWITPHVRDAFVRVSGHAYAGIPCGKGKHFAGSRAGAEWTAVDEWGQPTAKLRVTSSSVYDISGCRMLDLRVKSGRLSRVVSTGGELGPLAVHGSFAPPRSVACGTPARERSFRAFARSVGAGDAKRAPQIFCDGTTVRGVTGGKRLVVARLEGGKWRLELSHKPGTSAAVLGVFDMNGDGTPEIVVHRYDVDTYDDVVFSLDRAKRRWKTAFEGPSSGYA